MLNYVIADAVPLRMAVAIPGVFEAAVLPAVCELEA